MTSTQKKILVVDDEPDILAFLQELLEEEGYSVITTNKTDYINTLHNGPLPHLILLDVFLSGSDGREIVKLLKSQKATQHIPVIMFSAHPKAEETALRAGADGFVAKPFEMEELLARISSYL